MNSTIKIIIGAILCVILGSFILSGLKYLLFLGLAAGIGYLAIKMVSSKKLKEPSKGNGAGDA